MGRRRSTGSSWSGCWPMRPSYFARGWLAGHQRFALYGALVFIESTSRFATALIVAIGIGSGQGLVGLGMAIAPFASLAVIPFAFSRVQVRAPAGVPAADAAREGPAHAQLEEASTDLSLRHGADFAVQRGRDHARRADAAERGRADRRRQRPAGNLTSGLTGFVFNVMLIVRAPLQLFQAIQTSILPHLAGLEARESAAEFHRAIRTTVLAITAFALAVALGLLVIGPAVMSALLGDKGVLIRSGRPGDRRAGDGSASDLRERSTRPRWRADGRAPRRCVAGGGGAVRGVRRRLGDRLGGHRASRWATSARPRCCPCCCGSSTGAGRVRPRRRRLAIASRSRRGPRTRTPPSR